MLNVVWMSRLASLVLAAAVDWRYESHASNDLYLAKRDSFMAYYQSTLCSLSHFKFAYSKRRHSFIKTPDDTLGS